MTNNRTNEPTPERWRKKPVEIEARRFSGAMELIDAEGLALWCGGTFKHDTGAGQEYKTYYWSIEIPTLEGTMRATPGDYIIKGVQGEFYPCRGDIFEQTYEPAALVAAQGAAPPVSSFDTTAERVKTGADSLHVATVLPSSGVDEDALAEVEAERDAALAAVERVRAMHARRDDLKHPDHEGPVCDGCGDINGFASPWPCPTVAALDGAPEPARLPVEGEK